MAKNRNKKKNKNGADSMEISADTPRDTSEAMDTSEGKVTNSSKASLSDVSRKIKKGVQMKRSKNLRKLKAVAKAIASNEKSEEKVSRSKSKVQRVQSAKTLYD